jgi:hypothetical protein
MNKWVERKINNKNKKTHIRLTEIDCELFGFYVGLIQKVFYNTKIYENLSEEEKMTLDEGNRILSDINWFGWSCRNLKK